MELCNTFSNTISGLVFLCEKPLGCSNFLDSVSKSPDIFSFLPKMCLLSDLPLALPLPDIDCTSS